MSDPSEISSVSLKTIQYFQALRAGRWVVLGGVVGVIAGLGAVLFNLLVHGCMDLFFRQGLGWNFTKVGYDAFILEPVPGWHFWLLPLVPALGGLLSGFLVYTYAPEAEGHGTDAYIRSFHRLRGRIRSQVPIIKTIASAITIGTGGSAGREGPIAQIGAGFGSWLGQFLKLDASDCRTLLAAGTAGGIGAIFCAPLGGALFSLEVLYRNQEIETNCLIPAIISSLVSYSIFTTITGQSQVFHTPIFTFAAWELVPYAILGVLCALVGILYVTVFYGSRDYIFRKIPIRPHYVPMIGGLLLGVLAWWHPEILTGGYGWIHQALNTRMAIGFLIILLFAKIIATSLTISSGGSGGVFGPSLFIGAMIGASFGQMFHDSFPGWIADPRSFALVGMVGFFSGIAKTPIAALMMVTEMAHSYDLLVPMMLVSSLTYILTGSWTLYEEQVPSRADSPAHLGEYRTDLLAGMKVHEINIQNGNLTISYDMTLRQILPQVLVSSQNVFPVVDQNGAILGVFSLEELRTTLLEEQMRDLIIALDIANPDFAYVTPQEDLHSVLRKLTEMVVDEIPVLDPVTKNFLGVIKRRDILKLYSSRLYEIQQQS